LIRLVISSGHWCLVVLCKCRRYLVPTEFVERGAKCLLTSYNLLEYIARLHVEDVSFYIIHKWKSFLLWTIMNCFICYLIWRSLRQIKIIVANLNGRAINAFWLFVIYLNIFGIIIMRYVRSVRAATLGIVK